MSYRPELVCYFYPSRLDHRSRKSQFFKIERQTEISVTGRCVTRFERAIPLSHPSAGFLHHGSATVEPNFQYELFASPLFGVFRRFKFSSGAILALWPPVLTRRNPGEPSGGGTPSMDL